MPQAVVHMMKRDVEAQVVIQLLTCGKSQKDFQLGEAESKLRREELEMNKSRETLLCQQNQIMMTVLSKLADEI